MTTGCPDCDRSTAPCWRHSSYTVFISSDSTTPWPLCYHCGGTGREPSMRLEGNTWTDACRACGGTGKPPSEHATIAQRPEVLR